MDIDIHITGSSCLTVESSFDRLNYAKPLEDTFLFCVCVGVCGLSLPFLDEYEVYESASSVNERIKEKYIKTYIKHIIL